MRRRSTTHFRSREDLQTTLERYAKLYNDHLPQRALSHRTPRQAMDPWRTNHPEIFVRRLKNQTGLDMYRSSLPRQEASATGHAGQFRST
jgi:hypothetical protein